MWNRAIWSNCTLDWSVINTGQFGLSDLFKTEMTDTRITEQSVKSLFSGVEYTI